MSERPELADEIRDETIHIGKMLRAIKTLKYFDKYEKGNKIYFNQYWEERLDSNSAIEYANIVNVEDTLWTLEYYLNHVIVTSAQYSAFYPYRKNGAFVTYVGKGLTRKKTYYKKDEIEKVTYYYSNGIVHYEYKMKVESKDDWNTVKSKTYSIVNDSTGKNLLSDTGSGEEIVIDRTGLTIHNVFHNNKLLETYRIVGDNKVYQICDVNNEFKIKSLQSKLSSYLPATKFAKTTACNAQGNLFISLLIDPSGYVKSFKVLN